MFIQPVKTNRLVKSFGEMTDQAPENAVSRSLTHLASEKTGYGQQRGALLDDNIWSFYDR